MGQHFFHESNSCRESAETPSEPAAVVEEDEPVAQPPVVGDEPTEDVTETNGDTTSQDHETAHTHDHDHDHDNKQEHEHHAAVDATSDEPVHAAQVLPDTLMVPTKPLVTALIKLGLLANDFHGKPEK